MTEIKAPEILYGNGIILKFGKFVPADPVKNLVPSYHYRINLPDGTDVGHINFRIGDTPHIVLVAGHVGYEIKPEFRGNHYAYLACMALAPFIKTVYPAIIFTVNPDNYASIKIIEKCGARFLNLQDVPKDDPNYALGITCKKRYLWKLP